MKRFSYKPDLTADPSENTSVTECLIENIIQRNLYHYTIQNDVFTTCLI